MRSVRAFARSAFYITVKNPRAFPRVPQA